MKREIITTNDGSSSLFVPELNETYHSIHGAIQEAQHVFIKKGLEAKQKNTPLRILEVGFGTGLNCVLTLQKSNAENLSIHYTGLEKHLLTPDEIKAMNYGQELKLKDEIALIHASPWEKEVRLSENFTLLKQQFDLLKDKLQGKFDLVYFDAFAPNKQPEMWSEDVFRNLFEYMNDNALLVTYCCQGQVKRTMKTVGFDVKKTDGPPGKREMLTAKKTL